MNKYTAQNISDELTHSTYNRRSKEQGASMEIPDGCPIRSFPMYTGSLAK